MTKCTSCGIDHGMVVEDMNTGDTVPFDWCQVCLFTKGYTYKEPDPIEIDTLAEWGKKLQEMESKIIGDMSR